MLTKQYFSVWLIAENFLHGSAKGCLFGPLAFTPASKALLEWNLGSAESSEGCKVASTLHYVFKTLIKSSKFPFLS